LLGKLQSEGVWVWAACWPGESSFLGHVMRRQMFTRHGLGFREAASLTHAKKDTSVTPTIPIPYISLWDLNDIVHPNRFTCWVLISAVSYPRPFTYTLSNAAVHPATHARSRQMGYNQVLWLFNCFSIFHSPMGLKNRPDSWRMWPRSWWNRLAGVWGTARPADFNQLGAQELSWVLLGSILGSLGAPFGAQLGSFF
jgi:hypothetical protein